LRWSDPQKTYRGRPFVIGFPGRTCSPAGLLGALK
jgi:hypothetical protein